MRLHDYWRSSASYRVRIALALKGVDYETVPVNLVAGEQRGEANLAVNPQGLVPTLEVDGIALTQSLAIIDYLDHLYPDPPLLPTDPVERSRQIAMALVVAADIHPIDNPRVLNRLTAQFGADQPARDAWYAHWIVLGFEALEAMAAPAPFLGGATPSIADICFVPQMYNARRFNIPLNGYPKLVAADAAASAHPAFIAAHPDKARR
ncbi:maleylacetoacetate isomerase [Sphingomonas sp. GlSt437]|uniref:maleylacetoacetate isomerase n=1 Tax=Sphingomonas sp. GlSt437 TaxID=3389970 RepID=UPI003A85A694